MTPIDAAKAPFAVPKHWMWLQLSDIGLLSGGMTPSKDRSEFWDGHINWFSPKDIKSEELFASEMKITAAGVRETGLQLYPPGCLFIVARSGILKRTFPVSINRVEATANQDLKVLNPFVRGMERYLQVMFIGMTDFILSALVKTGTTVQSLKYDEFESLPIPLPPLEEQQRIVAKVGELMVLCARLDAANTERENRRDRVAAASHLHLNNGSPAEVFRQDVRFYINHLPTLITRLDHIQTLRRTILNLAVRGKLVEQHSTDEPASELLGRLRAQTEQLTREGQIKRQTELPQIKPEDMPFSIPPTWQWARFIQVAAIQSNLVDPSKYQDSPHIAPDNIESGTGILLPYDTIGSSAVFSAKHLFFAGCILYSKIRPALAKAVIVNFEGLCSADMYPILPFINREYLHKYMLSELFVRQSVSEDNRVAMPKINQVSLSKIVVPLPPLAEQYRIVARIDELMAVCHKLEAQLASAQAKTRGLLDAVLYRALNDGLQSGLESSEKPAKGLA